MKLVARAFVVIAALAAATLAFGFVLFATSVMRGPFGGGERADAIVVLTGGDNRVVEGARLFAEGRGKRLLISGVNRRTRREDVQRISGLDLKSFTCCVDLGYEALDTVGNADETRTWANTHGYTSLIVVTSSYHMPRGLAELSLAMPDRQLIPHAVTPRSFPVSGWWLHVATTRILLSEYLKYIPAVARLTAQRVMNWKEDRAIAVVEPKRTDG
ncbi:MAG: YdcF family protein [Hyphomicrobium sp.]|jgi:uncharacterized SAM-binding protein YcdF (DUF218 family)|nr:YdcF family protein [Hyphomicrobium sp.]